MTIRRTALALGITLTLLTPAAARLIVCSTEVTAFWAAKK